MNRLYTRLADIQWMPSAVAPVYTNPANTASYIKSIVIFNTSNGSANVKLYNVPDSGGLAGTAATSSQFFDVDLASKETLMIDLPYPITLVDAGDSIQAVSGEQTVTIQLLGDIAQ
jgi:hypothetical protein